MTSDGPRSGWDADELLARVCGELPPGTRVPPPHELALELGIELRQLDEHVLPRLRRRRLLVQDEAGWRTPTGPDDHGQPQPRAHWRRVADALSARVRTLPSGAPLPSPEALAGEAGVSVTVVRRALIVLEKEGVVRACERSEGTWERSDGPDPRASSAAAAPDPGRDAEAWRAALTHVRSLPPPRPVAAERPRPTGRTQPAKRRQPAERKPPADPSKTHWWSAAEQLREICRDMAPGEWLPSQSGLVDWLGLPKYVISRDVLPDLVRRGVLVRHELGWHTPGEPDDPEVQELRPRWRQVFERVAEHVQTFEPGATLPTVAELADTLGLTRVTIARVVLPAFEEAGVVKRAGGPARRWRRATGASRPVRVAPLNVAKWRVLLVRVREHVQPLPAGTPLGTLPALAERFGSTVRMLEQHVLPQLVKERLVFSRGAGTHGGWVAGPAPSEDPRGESR